MKLLILVVLLSGCASMMQPSSSMSAEQIAAATKDKSATVVCSTVIGAWGTVKLVTISLDQNAIKDGGVAVDGEKGCTANITSMAPPKPAPK